MAKMFEVIALLRIIRKTPIALALEGVWGVTKLIICNILNKQGTVWQVSTVTHCNNSSERSEREAGTVFIPTYNYLAVDSL